MKVLVLGTPGQLGHELMRAAWPSELEIAGVGYPDFDVGREADVRRVIADHAPDLVINATAYTAVDKAEGDRDAAFAINRDGPLFIARDCARRGIPMVHVSTDYVFDGAKDGAYVEDDQINPLNIYGESKAAGEQAVRETWERHVTLRTTWVYAAHGANFVKTMLRLGAEREEMSVVADQYGAPTAAADLAAAIVAIVPQIIGRTDAPWGTYHFTDAGVTTWHGFAERIFQHLEKTIGRRPRLKGIATAEYPTPARRPANSRLDCSKIRATFGVTTPPWEESLERVLQELQAN
jgi:dTDP-4-dehydrorhamnose reductase